MPPSVQRRVAAGTLSAGHARALLAISDPQEIERIAQRIINEGLSVRAVEEIISLTPRASGKKSTSRKGASPEIQELGDRIGDALDTRVKIEMTKKSGRILIDFGSIEDLHRIIKKIES